MSFNTKYPLICLDWPMS